MKLQIGGYGTDSSFDTAPCLIIFARAAFQSFKVQEDSRREFPVFFLAQVSHNLLLSSSRLCEGLLLQKKAQQRFYRNCLFRAVVRNILEPRRRFTEVAYSKEFAVTFLSTQLKTDP
jgi:hypothetical protein